MKKNKIVVALSGGVDSAVSAMILKKNGFYLEGIFMKNWIAKTDSSCTSIADLKYAEYICKILKIKLHVIDFSNEYWNSVFLIFLKGLKLGETPNPDILCNKKIKFNFLLKYILKILKFDFLATGHYAKIDYVKHQPVLKTSFDLNKDQTYFLHKLNPHLIKYIIFPLADYSKKEIRSLVKYYDFLNYNKKDSTGLCFIGNKKFYNFIKIYLTYKDGPIFTKQGKHVGFHKGLFFYTLGQRKNVSVQSNKTNNNKIWYIYKKNIRRNILYIDNEESSLLSLKVEIYHMNFINKTFLNLSLCAKIRHQINFIKCFIIKNYNKNIYIVIFKDRQRAITPGQYIVFYNANVCIGGATIKRSII